MTQALQPAARLVPATTHGRVLIGGAPVASSRGLVMGFHGYAERAEDQWTRLVSIPAADEWTLLSVQGLHSFYRGRSEEVVASWMTRQDRDTQIADNISYIDAVIADVLPTASRRAGSIVMIGFSQGVAMAFRAAVRGRHGAAGVVAVGGDVPPELFANTDVRFPPLLIARGTRDEWYTAEKLDADVRALEDRGVPHQTLVYDAGHEWTDEAARSIGAFLRSVGKA